MNQKIRVILYGFLIWFVPALFAMLVWDVENNVPKIGDLWFGSIIAALWAINFILVAYFYFRCIDSDYTKHGLIAGISWYVLCLLMDYIMVVLVSGTNISAWYPGFLSYLNNFFVIIGIGFILNKKIEKK